MPLMWLEDAKQLQGIYTTYNTPRKTTTGREYVKVILDHVEPGWLECRHCWRTYQMEGDKVKICQCGGRLFQKPGRRIHREG